MRDQTNCLVILIWPITSIIFGIVAGLLLGFSMAFWVCVLSALQTPVSIVKMMYLTATTTDKVFTDRYLDHPLRICAFILAPVPRLIYVIAITLWVLTFGTMYFIGKITDIMIKDELREWDVFRILDDYDYCSPIESKEIKITRLKDIFVPFNNGDDVYYEPMLGIKCVCALAPGIILGSLPFVPFSIMVLLITLYRLPINVYKTIKIALFTVVLSWDLKIASVLVLPFTHAMFIVIAFSTALIGSFFHFVGITTQSIVNSDSPFQQWRSFRDGLDKYYEAHQQFVGENQLGRYDHPTGIPSGWNGERYSIPIRKILKWQWDFFFCCFLLLLSLPICFTGSLIILTLKLIPSIFKVYQGLCDAALIHCWPCVLLALLLTPAWVLMISFLNVICGTLMSIRVPAVYLDGGYYAGFREPFVVISEVDEEWSGNCFDVDCRVFPCLLSRNEGFMDRPSLRNDSQTAEESMLIVGAYWDRFVSQCIHSASYLISKKWISLDDVENMEPSLVSAIPSISILQILADSINNSEVSNDEDIYWTIDGTICKKEDRPRNDNVLILLWPKVIHIKKLLNKEKGDQKPFAETHNIQVLKAMICNNTEVVADELRLFLDDNNIETEDHPNSAANKEIRSNLVELTLMLLRVKPYQDRMSTIFEHKYNVSDC